MYYCRYIEVPCHSRKEKEQCTRRAVGSLAIERGWNGGVGRQGHMKRVCPGQIRRPHVSWRQRWPANHECADAARVGGR
jgi:hypothetical protein